MKTKFFKRVVWLMIPLLTIFTTNVWGVTFSFSSAPTGWPSSSGSTASGSTEYTYTVDGTTYSFLLGQGCYVTSSVKWLHPKSKSTRLPGLTGYKLTKVVGELNSAGTPSTKSVVSITTDGSTVVSGGSGQIWNTKGGSYTYNLTGTTAGTRYYLTVSSAANCQIASLELTYTADAKTFTLKLPKGDGSYDETTTTDAEDLVDPDVASLGADCGGEDLNGTFAYYWTTSAIARASASTYNLTDISPKYNDDNPPSSSATLYPLFYDGETALLHTAPVCNTPCTEPTSVSITGTNKYLGGQKISLTATPDGGTGTLSYQWQKKINGTWTNLANGGSISGATSDNLQISSCGYGNSGGYRCIVSTGEGCEAKSHTDDNDGYGVHVFSLNGNYYGEAWSAHDITWTSGTTGKATVHLNASSTYMFKVYSNHGYYYGNGENNYIIQPVSWDCGTGNNDMRLFTTVEGDYTFTVNIEHGLDGSPYVNVQVGYPSMTHPNTGYVYVQKFDWRPYLHYWYDNSHALSAWGSDPQLNADQYTNICGTDYWCVPVIDYYCNFIAKDKAGDPGNTTNDQHTNSPHPGQRLYNNGSWNWGSFTTYTISYVGGGGTGSMSSHTNLCPGSSQQLTANAFSKAYHTFNGWSDGNGHTYANQATITNIQSNINLTAQWAPEQYNITATLTNVTSTTSFPVAYTYTGSAAGVTYTFAAADGFRLPNAVTVTGSTYTWNQATGQLTLTGTITGAVSITISGTQTHTVTWNVNGVTVSAASLGLASNPVVYDHGGSLVLPPTDPSVPGGCPDKVFMGWTAHTEITTETSDAPSFVSAGTAVNADVTYRAVFADKDDTGGSGSTDITISSSWTKSGTSGGGTAGTTGVILVTQDGVTLTHPKGYISTDVRMYKENDCTISVESPSKITKIEITTADNSYNATKWDSFDDNYSTVYDSGTSRWNGVWENTSGQTSVVFSVTEQVRFSKIKVFYTSVSYDNYITICSSCTTPSDLAVPTKTSTTGKVTWNGVSLSPSEGFKVAWNTTDSRPGTLNASNSADVAAGTNEYTINGLTPATRYYVWVQSKCNSTWSSSVNFYTNAKITYAAGTGSGSMTPKEVAYNTNATVDACTFTPPAYHVFNGWVSNQSVTVGGSSTTSVGDGATITNLTQAITLTAQWRVNSYNLTWNLGGGTTTSAGTGIASGVSVNTTTSVAYGTSLEAPTVTREGYTFSSWSPSVASTMPAAATTYTAQWTPNEYTVTWKVNGSNYSEGGSTSVNHGSKVTTLPTAPDPGDYCGDVFVGWTDATDGAYVHGTSNLYKTASEFPEATGNQIFYAVFADYAE